MERAVALNKIRKILGNKFNYRVDPKAPIGDEKVELRAKLTEAMAEQKAAQEKMDDYRRMLLNDKDYHALQEAYTAARNKADNLRGTVHSSKISVGIASGMFNFIKAEGDSWEEVIAKLKKK